jgi:hypothetical protein
VLAQKIDTKRVPLMHDTARRAELPLKHDSIRNLDQDIATVYMQSNQSLFFSERTKIPVLVKPESSKSKTEFKADPAFLHTHE